MEKGWINHGKRMDKAWKITSALGSSFILIFEKLEMDSHDFKDINHAKN